MRRIILALLLVLPIPLAYAADQAKLYPPEVPVVNLHPDLRQSNWGGGSCTWASMNTLLYWQGEYKLAKKIRLNFSGGEYLPQWGRNLDKAGVTYASTSSGDPEWLELACNGRRGAAVVVTGGRHMVTLVHLDKDKACLIDNNSPRGYIWLSREVFVDHWKKSGGWAFVPIYTPVSPLP